MKRLINLIKKIDFGPAVFGIILIVVIVGAVTFFSALVGGDLSRFPRAFFKTIGFLLVGPILIVILWVPIVTVWYIVEGLTTKIQLALENTEWLKRRPGNVKTLRFIIWTLSSLLCLVSGSILLGRAQSSRGGWIDFVTGALAIILLFVGLQFFAFLAFNPFVARVAGRLWAAFRKK